MSNIGNTRTLLRKTVGNKNIVGIELCIFFILFIVIQKEINIETWNFHKMPIIILKFSRHIFWKNFTSFKTILLFTYIILQILDLF